MVIDEDVKSALEGQMSSWPDITSRRMFGGAGFMVQGKMFAALAEGVVGMKLPDDLRAQALTLAGVSPFRPSGGPFGEWVQFVLLMEDDVPAVAPWLEAAFDYVASLPAPKKRGRKRSA